MKVIASSLRKGNVVEIDGKLYRRAHRRELPSRQGHADHPDRHAPHLRRGEDRRSATRPPSRSSAPSSRTASYKFLYQDGDGFHFMNAENYDQVTVPADVIGDQAAYLQRRHEGDAVGVHEGIPIAIELPQRVTLEVDETEPTIKGQTASSSYKPAMLSNGVRTMVPPLISAGTRSW